MRAGGFPPSGASCTLLQMAPIYPGSFHIIPRPSEGSQYNGIVQWPAVDELWIAGAWESGQFGRWLPAASQETGAVVEMLWPNFGLVIGGSPLRAYLFARTDYDLICYNGPTRPSMPYMFRLICARTMAPRLGQPLVGGPIRHAPPNLTPLMAMSWICKGLESYSARAGEPSNACWCSGHFSWASMPTARPVRSLALWRVHTSRRQLQSAALARPQFCEASFRRPFARDVIGDADAPLFPRLCPTDP